jgi:hypothetical protein
MSRTRIIMLALVGAFIALQFVPSARNESGQMLAADITKTIAVPPTVQAVLKTSCYDCHSNRSYYPWYSNLQPLRWMLDRHIREGKENLNFSEFGAYSARRQQNKLRAIKNSMEEGTMPLSSYTLMHRNARMTMAEKELIISWAMKAKDSLAGNN